MNKKIGFIGSGKMASAIIKGLLKSNFITSTNILASQKDEDNLEDNAKKLGIKITTNNQEIINFADVIIFAVKPNQIQDIIKKLPDHNFNNKLVISVLAGVTTKTLENLLPHKTKIVRVMPNTPALLGEGMTGIFGGKFATEKDIKYVQQLFNTIGKTIIVTKEEQMNIVTAISGSGPAFFYKVINEIALAGEKLGLDYDKALLLSIQTALGSSKMALHREIPMEELISNVATKGGCTRVGVDKMDEFNSNNIFFEVIKNTTEKAEELGK